MKNFKSLMALTALLWSSNSFNAQTNNPAPYCTSAFSNNYNMIQSVSLGGTAFVIGPSGSFANQNTYMFYNNAQFPSLTVGAAGTLSIGFYSEQDMEPIYFAAWIDFNNNNTFDSAEMLMNNANTSNQALPTFAQNSVTLTKSFTVPATAQPGSTRIRVVRASHSTNPYGAYTPTFFASPCNAAAANNYGCTYDFSVAIVAPVQPKPVVQFSANVTALLVNGTVALTDQSTNSPNSWNWVISPPSGYTFTNNTNASSQNPRVKFTSAGTYTVKLKATNMGGADSLTKTSYIKVNAGVFLPEEETNNGWSIYPNPANNYLIVCVSPGRETHSLYLTDIMGKVVKYFNSGTNQADISDLLPGTYMLMVENQEGKIAHRQRIIKQ